MTALPRGIALKAAPFLALAALVALMGVTGRADPGVAAEDAAAKAKPDTDAAAKAVTEVVELHFEGVKNADAAHLEKAWDAPNAHVKSVVHSKLGDTVKVEPAAEAIKRWTDKPSPDAAGSVKSVEFAAEDMACVRVEFHWRGADYDEFLVLLKLNQSWKIVNKTYRVRPDASGAPAKKKSPY